jgi:hypothetical protein
MRDDRDEVCNLNFPSALRRRHSTWRNEQRHRNAVTMLARQIAFMEVGQEATANEFAAYLKQHRARLTAEAKYIIASRAGLASWRACHGVRPAAISLPARGSNATSPHNTHQSQEQILITNHLAVAHYNSTRDYDDPDLGGSGDGVRSGPGSRGRGPAPILYDVNINDREILV